MLQLPKELLWKILELLDARSVARLGAVNRHLHVNFVTSERLWSKLYNGSSKSAPFRPQHWPSWRLCTIAAHMLPNQWTRVRVMGKLKHVDVQDDVFLIMQGRNLIRAMYFGDCDADRLQAALRQLWSSFSDNNGNGKDNDGKDDGNAPRHSLLKGHLRDTSLHLSATRLDADQLPTVCSLVAMRCCGAAGAATGVAAGWVNRHRARRSAYSDRFLKAMVSSDGGEDGAVLVRSDGVDGQMRAILEFVGRMISLMGRQMSVLSSVTSSTSFKYRLRCRAIGDDDDKETTLVGSIIPGFQVHWQLTTDAESPKDLLTSVVGQKTRSLLELDESGVIHTALDYLQCRVDGYPDRLDYPIEINNGYTVANQWHSGVQMRTRNHHLSTKQMPMEPHAVFAYSCTISGSDSSNSSRGSNSSSSDNAVHVGGTPSHSAVQSTSSDDATTSQHVVCTQRLITEGEENSLPAAPKPTGDEGDRDLADVAIGGVARMVDYAQNRAGALLRAIKNTADDELNAVAREGEIVGQQGQEEKQKEEKEKEEKEEEKEEENGEEMREEPSTLATAAKVGAFVGGFLFMPGFIPALVGAGAYKAYKMFNEEEDDDQTGEVVADQPPGADDADDARKGTLW